MSEPHTTAEKLPVGRPFANGDDPRRNAGGRPHGLAKLAREAVGDGTDLIAFYSAILRGDAKTLGVRQIRLQDRLEAAEWLAERGWGKAPLIVDLPDEPPQANLRDLVLAWMEALPPDLRKALADHLGREFHAAIDAEVAAIEEQVRATMPQGWSPSRPVRPLD